MADEEKHVTFKLYRDSVPRLLITYKNKDELYERFMKKVKQLGIPIGELYSFDWENDYIFIENADDLMAAVENNYNVKVYITSPKKSRDHKSCSSSDSVEQEEQKKTEKCGTPRRSASRKRSPLPVCTRGRSWSEPRHGSRVNEDYPFYLMPWNYGLWNHPRYQAMSLYEDTRVYELDLRGKRKQKCHNKCREDSR